MARFNRGMALRPVHRIKHVVDAQQASVAGTAWTTDIIKSVDAPVITGENEVETGSKVNGIYLKVVVATTTAVGTVTPNVYLAIFKNPGHAIVAGDIQSVGDSDVKRYFIHQEMTMVQNATGGNPTVLFNGVIKIPKGYIRNGPNDRLEVIVLCPQIGLQMCLQAHYKEFR